MLKRNNDEHLIQIVTGATGRLGRMTNKELTWVCFKEKLKKPLHDTDVTFAQYMKLPKEGRGGQYECKARPGLYAGVTCIDGGEQNTADLASEIPGSSWLSEHRANRRVGRVIDRFTACLKHHQTSMRSA